MVEDFLRNHNLQHFVVKGYHLSLAVLGKLRMNIDCLVGDGYIADLHRPQLIRPDEAVILHHTGKVERRIVFHRIIPQAYKI